MVRKLFYGILVIIIFLLIIFIYSYFLSSNKINHQIITKTYDTNKYIIGINYPKSNISEFDSIISNYINSQYNFFIDNYGDSEYLIDRDELNIDYKYYLHDNKYISLSLITYINSYKIKYPINKIKTFFYSIKENKFYSLNDIIIEEEQDNLVSIIKQTIKNNYSSYIIEDNIDSIISNQDLSNLPFHIDSKNLIIYLNLSQFSSDYYEFLELKIPLSILSFNINLTQSNNVTFSEIKETSNIIDPTKKVVALTFDDGPSIYTKDIINILKENDACATFFILGNKVEFYQEVLLESIKNGNELGNHSYNHKWLSRLSINNLKDQIESTQNIIYEKLNYVPVYLRPTYGSVTNRIRKNTDLKIALWNVDTKDWKIKNVDRIVERATTDIEDSDIILMHDIFERSSLALKDIITILKEQEFQFVTLSELEEVKKLREQLN